MCTSREIMGTVAFPESANYFASEGWVQFIPVVADSKSTDPTLYMDASGYRTDTPNCSQWKATPAGEHGMTVSGLSGSVEGVIESAPCRATDVGVACCGPAS